MKYPKYTLLAVLLYGFSSLPAIAATVDESPTTHNTTGTAQVLAVDGSTIQVNGMLNANDLDVYAVDVQASDVLTFDIDCGYLCGTGSVDTKLTLFDSADMSVIWQSNDDGGVMDSGSNSGSDPLIQNVSLGHAGTVYVLVSHWDTTITSDSGGNVTAVFGESAGTAGDYQLIITGATAPVTSGSTGGSTGTSSGGEIPEANVATTETGDQVINVNINPFYKGKWPRINPKARGVIPVAILSQEGFNPADVVLESLRFGAIGTEDSLVRCKKLHRDLNRDSVRDLLCFFSMRKGGFDASSESGVLTGTLEDGTSITGQAPLKMVPYKRRNHGSSAYGGNRRR